MQLKKRVDNKPVQRQEPKTVSQSLTNKSKPKYQIDPLAEIPYGKHQGKTVAWVQANESSYWSWIEREDLIEKWSLYKTGEPKKVQALAADDGLRWICLIFEKKQCTPSKWL